MRGPHMDLGGRIVAGDEPVTVRLRPGIGIQYEGAHLEGGPHVLPARIAYDLVGTQRADLVRAEAVPVEGAPEGVEQRDPVVESREGARRGRR